MSGPAMVQGGLLHMVRDGEVHDEGRKTPASLGTCEGLKSAVELWTTFNFSNSVPAHAEQQRSRFLGLTVEFRKFRHYGVRPRNGVS